MVANPVMSFGSPLQYSKFIFVFFSLVTGFFLLVTKPRLTLASFLILPLDAFVLHGCLLISLFLSLGWLIFLHLQFMHIFNAIVL
jgi:hypothetical protein